MLNLLRASRSSLAVSFALFFALSASAHAAALYVANDGTDGGSCGAKTAPCRSITQGIANSAAGGDIVVGPGLYGDLDYDGVLGETGEEPIGPCLAGTCLVNVNKQVSITSSDGAFATVISPGQGSVDVIVALDANGIVFGDKNKGFTIKPVGPVNYGIVTYLAADVVIEGNVVDASNAFFGMRINSTGTQVLGNRVLGSATGYGIYLQTTDVVLAGNVITGANLGIALEGSGHLITGNVASGGIVGLLLSGTGTIVSRCSFLGNATAGILVGGVMTTATVTESNIVGNAEAIANCGFDANGSAVTVKDSYWGSAAGPGANPADATCNDVVGSAVPFATKAVKVKVRGIR